MTIEEALIEAVRSLPQEKMQELLDHVNRLRQTPEPKKPFQSIKGLWSDMGISLSADEIDEARLEAWKKFTREER